MINREPVDEYLDSQDEEDDTCPVCGADIDYFPELDWGRLVCTKCPWEQRL